MKQIDSSYGLIVVFDNPQSLICGLADQFVELAKSLIAASGRFTVALSGGSTPKGFYELLASNPYRTKVNWGKILLFLADERCVPHTSPDSNYRMIYESLVSKVPIPKENVFSTEEHEKDPNKAAQQYEEKLRLALQSSPQDMPSLDLVLLGLGSDGHTASLFPGSRALQERSRIFVSNFVAKLDSWRLTLTLPAINKARQIIFLVSGESKAEILSDIMHSSAKYPAQMVYPKSGNLCWYVDRSAAGLLDLAHLNN